MAVQTHALTDIDKPRYRYWQALYLSFFSQPLYVDVGKRWRGLGLLYFLLLLSLTLLPFSIRLIFEFKTQVQLHYLNAFKTLPVLTIENGRLVFDKPMPFLIKNDYGEVIGVIDTTGQVSTKTADYPAMVGLITARQIILWPPSPDTVVLSLPTVQGLTVDKKQWIIQSPAVQSNKIPAMVVSTFPPSMNQTIDLKKLFPESFIKRVKIFYAVSLLLIYPCIVLLIFTMTFIFILAFGLMGQLLVSLFFSYKLAYAKACRLLAVATTPASIGMTVLYLLGIPIPRSLMAVLVVTMVYYFYGAMALKRDAKQVVVR